jgi:lysozyme
MLRSQLGRAVVKYVVSVSLAALASLAIMEGWSSPPYQDEAGVWTNGYGNTVGVTRNTKPVSREQGMVDLTKNVDIFTGSVVKSLTRPTTQGQLDSYVQFSYNIGAAAFATSSTAKAHNAGKYMDACLYMLRWTKLTEHGVLRQSRGLWNRRYNEYNVCLSGVPDVGYVPRRN